MVGELTESQLLRWIPLLPLLAAAVHGVLLGVVRRSLPRGVVILLSCGAVILSFLLSFMPSKSVVDLYAMLGLQKQAKTLFYRQLQHHLGHSRDDHQEHRGAEPAAAQCSEGLPPVEAAHAGVHADEQCDSNAERCEEAQGYRLLQSDQ